MRYLVINSLIKETISIFHCLHATLWKQYSLNHILWFYFSEFLYIARCSLKHFLPRASGLYLRMLLQGASQSCIKKQILKSFQRYPDVLKNIARIITNSFKQWKILYIYILYDMWKHCALLIITTMGLWQPMYLGTWHSILYDTV